MTSSPGTEAPWQLGRLLEGLVDVPARWDRPVGGISADSRQVGGGELFFARPGATTDGRHFIDDAVRAGAVAVVTEGEAAPRVLARSVPQLTVPDVRDCIGVVADRFYRAPSRHLRVVGVTGTNGKTSVSNFIAEALGAASRARGAPGCGVLGTLGYGLHGALRAGDLTTPDAITVHRCLAELRAAGARDVVMEVSSHALDQGRVAGVRFTAAVFTNLTRDHLDYHRDMSAYGLAKRRLFEQSGLGHAIVNVDDAFGESLVSELPEALRVVGYGLEPRGREDARSARREHIAGDIVALDAEGITLALHTPWGDGELRSPVLGRLNAHNLLAAAATLLALELPLDEVIERLAGVAPVPGRMQPFGGGDRLPLVVVDYAHTPDALERALDSLREQRRGRLWCVFGCGGERDRGKRPLMGAAAATGADEVVLTDDNPRGEDGNRIIEDIRAGIAAGVRYRVERDRGRAIRIAVAGAAPGDVVLVAGKGHEPYQEVDGERHPFSDAQAVRAALEEVAA